MASKNMTVVSAKIPIDVAGKLDQFCSDHNINRARLIRMLIEEAIEQGRVSAKPSLERAMRVRNDFITLLLDVRDTLDTLLEETAGSAGVAVS
jgi:metal-responsive CopG/Arc/MetJ family transcriptional regulator